jgi:phage shock protein PspC (stress-responsive transcriptional regulator)
MRDVDRLRRSTGDRYVAGVAGGLGRHFDIDPTVVRVALVVLTLFGGAGAIIYGAVWLFVPEDGQDRAPVDLTPDVRRVVLVVAAAVALMIVFGTPFLGDSWGFGFPFPLIVVGVIALVLYLTRAQWRSSSSTEPPPPWGSTLPAGSPTGSSSGYAPSQEGTSMSTTDSPTHPGSQPVPPGVTPGAPTSGMPTGTPPAQQPPAWVPPPAPAYVPPPRPRRTGLVLFWPTLALIAIGLGTLGVVDAGYSVNPSAYAALALTITAVMLLVGAFVGRPGGLIALGVLGSLVLGGMSTVEASTDWETGGETLTAAPGTAALVQDVYSVPNGEIDLDLSRVRDVAALDGREIAARLNAGEITVTLPPGVNAIVEADMDVAGDINIDGSHRGGIDQSLTRTLTGSTDPDAPTLTLDLDARVGQITVAQP